MLQVYSTLTRTKQPFHKRPGEPVSLYVCGPTVYKPSHIGHMVGPVIFDTVKRYLTYRGHPVKWVVNITDVDDKLITRAAELGTTVPALADRMTTDYKECLARLNVTGIDLFPKATDHVPGMIAMIGRLIAKGFAYPADGDVYFDVAHDSDYGKLCNRDPEQLEAGARIEVSARKRNPGDFALWKGAKPGEPAEVTFASPWGPGRPGWHIECSVMSQELLGDTLDIHGGGLDLQFPHHENELAQSESDTDKPFAQVWMHNGLLRMRSADGTVSKMAGSIGNVVNIADLLERHTPETVRLLLLSTHYRSPIEYSEARLEEVARSLQTFYRYFERYKRITGESFYALPVRADAEVPGGLAGPIAELRLRYFANLDDDFNTGGAVGILFETLATLNKFADESKLDAPNSPAGAVESLRAATGVLREFGDLLGLFWQAPTPKQLSQGNDLIAGLMELILEVRANLRDEAKSAAKDNPLRKSLFAQTDHIRARLAELNVTLEDRATGTTWRVD